MKLSKRKAQAIRNAVHEEITKTRVKVRRMGLYLGPAAQERLDAELASMQDRAGQAAIAAAEKGR